MNQNEKQVVSQEERREMEEVIAEELIANDIDNEQVREIITCKNIEVGEKKYLEFKGVFRLNGKFIPKVGRPLSFEELQEKMPEMFEAIENIEGNPVDAIEDEKEFTASLTVKSNEEKALRRINAQLKGIEEDQGKEVAELIKGQLLEKRELLKEEIKVVEAKGVNWNENLVWDIWMILRANRQRKYMEDEDLPVDYLIELYSYIPRGEFKRIKEHYRKSFDE